MEEMGDAQEFIDFHEEKLLRALFGNSLYDDFVDGIGAGTPEQKWIDLRDGKVYTIGAVEYKFLGLIDLLKPMIFSKWLRDNARNLSNAGVLKNIPDKTQFVSPNTDIVKNQNLFAWKVGNSCRLENTFYGFMYINWADYVTLLTDWQFTDPGFENVIGI